MDPQQKILLEVVYEAVETAGYSISKLRGSSTAVFVGQMTDDYYDILLRDVDNIPQYAGTGSARSIVANRISYFFDWKGPSMNIDTACSSSLVALHQAVQSLRSGESELAVVAGVNLILGPEHYITESKVRCLIPDSHILLTCTSFICSRQLGGHGCGMLVQMGMPAAKASQR